jgi:ADP-ribosylglycohydrolase
MKGAILGDIVGSVYEFDPIKTTAFDFVNPKCRFTDDTVLTIAIMDAILSKEPYESKVVEYAKAYPGRGYGHRFCLWIGNDGKEPYGSYGNGSAMRVSPVGWAFDDLEKVELESYRSEAITRNHEK